MTWPALVVFALALGSALALGVLVLTWWAWEPALDEDRDPWDDRRG